MHPILPKALGHDGAACPRHDAAPFIPGIDPVSDTCISILLIDCVQTDRAAQLSVQPDQCGQTDARRIVRLAGAHELRQFVFVEFIVEPSQPSAQMRAITLEGRPECRNIRERLVSQLDPVARVDDYTIPLTGSAWLHSPSPSLSRADVPFFQRLFKQQIRRHTLSPRKLMVSARALSPFSSIAASAVFTDSAGDLK